MKEDKNLHTPVKNKVEKNDPFKTPNDNIQEQKDCTSICKIKKVLELTHVGALRINLFNANEIHPNKQEDFVGKQLFQEDYAVLGDLAPPSVED